MSCFLLLPAGEEELAGTPGLHPKPLPPPVWYKNPTGAVHDRTFALCTNAAERTRMSISPQDALEHTLLLGPTGAGKSTVLLNLALADMRAGRSVLVIDPKNDLIHDILARIPENREKDVVIIDPSDHHPVGFNPLAFKRYRNPTLIADAVLAVFKEIFRENWGIRSQDVLSAALLTLAKIEGASLLWLPALLTDDAFRRKIAAQVKDKIALQPYRDKYDLMPYHEKARVYAQMFEFMNDRKPNFSPAVLDRIKQSEEISSARSSLKAREFMYKAAPKPREKVPEAPPDPNAAILAKIPMPWKAPEAEEEEMEEALPPPGEESYRMESLRYGGWNVRRDPGERKAP